MQTVTTSEHPSTPGSRSGETPLFLVGPARSGTSLIYKVLCLHRDAAYIPNWLARYPRRPRLAAVDRIARALPALRRRVWFGSDGSNAYVYGRERPWWERAFPMPVEGEPVYATSGIGETLSGEGSIERFRELIRVVTRTSGGHVFINKRIANNRRIELLRAAFPDSRFVALVRDGRAVALSLSKVDWWETSTVPGYGDTPARWRTEGGDPWELCARNWVEDLDAMEAGLDGVDPSDVLRVSYESFIEDPAGRLDRIASFAGLGDDPSWRRAVRELRFPNRNESWRRELDADAIDTITRVQRAHLARYGYAA